jgi:SAM-dependent methyltransferase
LAERYQDRARAESFGGVAEAYDRFRPAPPAALLDALAALAPARVLDVGCGTGKVARGLMARGLDVLGVETDERMAHVARAHGVEVEVAPFEDWDARGRRFDLITCGDAWHWIDPARGWRRIGEVLAHGGQVARFWTEHELAEPMRSTLDAVLREWAPELLAPPPHATDDDPRTRRQTFEESRRYGADEWVGLMGTISFVQTLAPEHREALERELHAAVERRGGTVAARFLAHVRFSGQT